MARHSTGTITTNPTEPLSSLGQWSAACYAYTPNPNGTIPWTRTNSLDAATLIDTGGTKTTGSWTVVCSLVSGMQYSYKTRGDLLAQNRSGFSGGGDTVTYTAIGTPPTQMLDAANGNPILWSHYRRTGRPTHVCIDSYFRGKEMGLRARGARPCFGPPGKR
jgi:hypothetical protein